MLRKAREVIASGDERAIVDYAIEVNRMVTQASEELKKAKAHLRKIALGRAQGAPSIEIEGNLGVAEVSFAKPEVKACKGKNLRDIEVNLTPEVFARLFSKEILIRPLDNFQDRLLDLSPANRAVVDQFFEVQPSTPKVYLTK